MRHLSPIRLVPLLGLVHLLTPSAANPVQKRCLVKRSECKPETDGGPYLIDEKCVDPVYGSPYVLDETEETEPHPHRKVTARFNGTSIGFILYLPPPEDFTSRFFQHVYPLQDAEAEPERVGFGLHNGAYTVNVAGAGGYRADAAAAKFSREYASEYYEDFSGHIYGYIYGGSGGSLVTVGALEATTGVWDGGMPMIQAIPISNPNNFAVRALGGLALRDEKEQIIDAIAPGGSGDPFSGLESWRRDILTEVTKLGIPLAAWEDFERTGGNKHNLLNTMVPLVSGAIRGRDPSYPSDFWSKPGYAGTADSELGRLFRRNRVQVNATIQDVILNDSTGEPQSVVLEELPANISTIGLDLSVLNDGRTGVFEGSLAVDNLTITISTSSNQTVLELLEVGAVVNLDNSVWLSGFEFYRHQIPPADEGYYGYDALRDSSGAPIYPQRDVFLAPLVSKGASGGVEHTGKVKAKTMLLQALSDPDAWPWHADWYKNQVRDALGEEFEDNFRLYYVENAEHYIESPLLPAPDGSRIVPLGGHAEQHLLDLSDWVERGIEAPKSSVYSIDTLSQVHLADSAEEWGGIQPTVDLTVGGGNRTEVSVGEAVEFDLRVEVPPGLGEVVSVEWDFEGKTEFEAVDFGAVGSSVHTQVSNTYEKSGAFFAGVRVSSHRDGDTDTPYSRVWNLARVRVVVQ